MSYKKGSSHHHGGGAYVGNYGIFTFVSEGRCQLTFETGRSSVKPSGPDWAPVKSGDVVVIRMNQTENPFAFAAETYVIPNGFVPRVEAPSGEYIGYSAGVFARPTPQPSRTDNTGGIGISWFDSPSFNPRVHGVVEAKPAESHVAPEATSEMINEARRLADPADRPEVVSASPVQLLKTEEQKASYFEAFTAGHAANFVRSARLQAQLTQAALAEKLGISQSRIAELERGSSKQGPTLGLLARIASACGKKLELVLRS